MKDKKRERLTAFNRKNILESAHKLFLEKGIAGATMDDISKEAGCSKTTIYSYFENKEEIVNHLFFEGISFFQNKVQDEAKNSRNFKDFYKSFCASVVSIHKEQPIFYEGVAGEAIFDKNASPDSILNKIYQSGEMNFETIEHAVRKAVKDNEIVVDDNLSEIIMFLWFCIMGIVEKSALKESYLKQKIGKNRQEFMDYAFNKLYSMIART